MNGITIDIVDEIAIAILPDAPATVTVGAEDEPLEVAAEPVGASGPPGGPGPQGITGPVGPVGGSQYDDMPDITLLLENALI
jgi:hypothetical protein